MASSNTVRVHFKLVNSEPTFGFKPPILDVSDVARVMWRPAKGSTDFTFAALVFHHKNPFKDIVVHRKANEMSALDDYEVPARHTYSVLVKVRTAGKTTYYNSTDAVHPDDGPTIRNK